MCCLRALLHGIPPSPVLGTSSVSWPTDLIALLTLFSAIVPSDPESSFFLKKKPNISQSGHGRLARQMTLLMAFCDYLGNSVKVLPSACIQLKGHALV
jgi:hypothetical protein